MNPTEPSGVIVDGWSYVWAAYAVFWVFLSGYSASLWIRSREER